jgi:hypothetical protein
MDFVQSASFAVSRQQKSITGAILIYNAASFWNVGSKTPTICAGIVVNQHDARHVVKSRMCQSLVSIGAERPASIHIAKHVRKGGAQEKNVLRKNAVVDGIWGTVTKFMSKAADGRKNIRSAERKVLVAMVANGEPGNEIAQVSTR